MGGRVTTCTHLHSVGGYVLSICLERFVPTVPTVPTFLLETPFIYISRFREKDRKGWVQVVSGGYSGELVIFRKLQRTK
nr:MAG TPA: hypothetical protein [Caudoviricetes sp.]